MANETLLIIEDDAGIRRLVRYSLEREGYKVAECASSEEARVYLARTLPDLILLDLTLPGTDGYAFCRALRAAERTAKIPVIMLTARGKDSDIVAGFEAGADDYVTKPFVFRVLSARVRAVLRRRAGSPGDDLNVSLRGPIEIDRTRHTVKTEGEPVSLTMSEFKTLELLMNRPGTVFSRYQIMDVVHGDTYSVADRSVDVVIVGLRRKLGRHGKMIDTVRGFGYRLNIDKA